MMLRPRRFLRAAAPLALALPIALAAAGAAAAESFPPISDEERALTAVPGQPNAPAVGLDLLSRAVVLPGQPAGDALGGDLQDSQRPRGVGVAERSDACRHQVRNRQGHARYLGTGLGRPPAAGAGGEPQLAVRRHGG